MGGPTCLGLTREAQACEPVNSGARLGFELFFFFS